ncbi:MAG: enoyl-CoA hydratase/isomerase family protein [Spirochaetota bacterium]|nr:enoyl-CoA hydratase/isomerase family protein [Spirochaetota bacterium]
MTNKQVLENRIDHIGIISLNNPEKRNAVNIEMLKSICEILRNMENDGIRTIIIRGAGDKMFCAGFDVQGFVKDDSSSEEHDYEKTNYVMDVSTTISEINVPVIAMINGHCFGAGIDISLACDLRYASSGVKMGLPPVNLGIIYNAEATRRVMNIAGLAKAKELLFLAKEFTSDEAAEMGLVNKTVSKEGLEEYVMGIAYTLCDKSPLSIKGTKKIFNLILEHQELSEQRQIEADRMVVDIKKTEDAAEAAKAFLEKRKPIFKGR